MKRFVRAMRGEEGFSLIELGVVLMGGLILLAAAVPVVTTAWNQYRLVLAAQSVSAQLQHARMKSVSSNESFRVHFPSGQNVYQVETSTGTVMSGPFSLPPYVSWNNIDTGTAVSFPGRYVSFLPTGNIPTSGNGSAGRVKLINPSGYRIDIVVVSGGVIRQTPAFRTATPPF